MPALEEGIGHRRISIWVDFERRGLSYGEEVCNGIGESRVGEKHDPGVSSRVGSVWVWVGTRGYAVVYTYEFEGVVVDFMDGDSSE